MFIMDDIRYAIKIFNIGSTSKKTDIRNLDYNNKTPQIDKKESVNIRTIIETFMKQYTDFKKEYDNIKKLDSYNDLEYIGFYKKSNEKSLCLSFFDNNKTMKSKYGYLSLILKEENDVCSCYVENDCIGKDYDIKKKRINKKVIKSYIALFEKYKDLLDAYNFFQKQFVFGNGFNVMYIKINGNILNKLKSMEINFGNCCMNRSDDVSLEIELLNEHKFLKEEITIDNKAIEPTSEIETYLLNEVYLNKEYLPTLYKYISHIFVENRKLNAEVAYFLKKYYVPSTKLDEKTQKEGKSPLQKKK